MSDPSDDSCQFATDSVFLTVIGESRKGRMADALAHGGDEGRDKLR